MAEVGSNEYVLKAAGITYRQLDHWTTKGWLKPHQERSGSGHHRRWSAAETEVAIRMGRLVRAGLRPEVATVVARRPRGSTVEIGDGIVIVVDPHETGEAAA